MVKAYKIEATLMNSPFSAKYRPGQILGKCTLHQQLVSVMKKCGHLPPAKTKDERRRVWRASEVELAIAYEAFGTELVGILVYFRIVSASPDGKRVPVSAMSAVIPTRLFVPDVGENECLSGNEIPSELVIVRGHMRH